MINAFQIESLNVLGLSDSKAIIITCYYGEAASEDKRMLSGARGRTPFCGLVLFALYANEVRSFVRSSSQCICTLKSTRNATKRHTRSHCVMFNRS